MTHRPVPGEHTAWTTASPASSVPLEYGGNVALARDLLRATQRNEEPVLFRYRCAIGGRDIDQ
ncbi:msl8734 [Mesorhizobium japonicum MAFF 303099]|uniref:Msl8734 protein n=1 Tax=Mesorhizobium japonicum (strain LMG 29417 / CECT 9101 / MAFF 303099) TaxID=266835 RepID=Q983B9_RHILO|nr:msl8734 [Mesorhizobium japonicum MAFF 303099]